MKKAGSDDVIYKNAGSVLIKAKKEDVIKELEEKKELSNTRVMVLGKQETRVKENLKEVENKINEMIRACRAGACHRLDHPAAPVRDQEGNNTEGILRIRV